MSLQHAPTSAPHFCPFTGAPRLDAASPQHLSSTGGSGTQACSGTVGTSHDGGRREGVVRLQVFSDLHADVDPGEWPVVGTDVDAVVVAGDTCRGPAKGFALLRRIVPAHVKIVAVAGNHEHYRSFLPETLAAARRSASDHDVTFLEDTSATVAGVRFHGSTLWTDYALYGPDAVAKAMASAASAMNDHLLIGWSREPTRLFRPADAAEVHRASRAFLARTLEEPFAGPTVVLTHHAPHPRSVHPRYELDPLNAAFASDLGVLIEAVRPALWVHGHTHTSFDYRVGTTRVLCNPRGYGSENPDFDPTLVVEVPR